MLIHLNDDVGATYGGDNPYLGLLGYVQMYGKTELSREGDTLVVPSLTFSYGAEETVHTGSYNPALGFVEACQIIAGVTDREALMSVAPMTFRKAYFDRSNVEYGERIGQQLDKVIAELSADPFSRRVVTIAGPGVEEAPDERPCAVGVQWAIHSGILTVDVFQRSWDLFRGLPYNLQMWGITSQVVASLLRLFDIQINIHTTTPHIYKEDIPKITGPQTMMKVQLRDWCPTLQDWRKLALEELEQAPWCTPCEVTSWHRKPTFIEVKYPGGARIEED